jgi:hypothetical protein
MALNPQGPPMQQIAEWLESLGMSEYAQRFAENGIDFSVLPHLTDQGRAQKSPSRTPFRARRKCGGVTGGSGAFSSWIAN